MSDIYKLSARLMRMTEKDWNRHANPLSVWLRFSCLPLLVAAIYTRDWIGWAALPLVLLALLWIWLNPRLVRPPRDFGSWAARGTLGERIFLARDRVPVPSHHRRAAHVLTALSGLSLLPLAWGLIALDPSATLAGLAASMLTKLWFVDRMVWLHADLTRTRAGDPLSRPLLPDRRGQ